MLGAAQLRVLRVDASRIARPPVVTAAALMSLVTVTLIVFFSFTTPVAFAGDAPLDVGMHSSREALAAPSSRAALTLSLDHLNLLKATIETPSGPLPIWYIYATPSAAGYRPVEAPGEGIACVDDVARALLIYLEHFELTGDLDSLAHARDAISFLAYMRQDDGTYANFIDRQGNVNLTGITSRPGVNWWMARAMWGLAKARAVFDSVDPQYALWIADLLTPSVNRLVNAVGDAIRGTEVRPVVVGGGTDVSAIFLMTVSILHSVEPDPTLEQVATALALGLRGAQAGDAVTPPYRAFSPNPGAPAIWTGWGSHGMEALAMAGVTFERPEWISWAAETAHALGSYLVAGPGALAAQGPGPIRYPQIAYDQSPMVRGLEWLHRATSEPLYSDLAFLTASWLFGNNPAGEPMHHLPSGRTFDGIDGDNWDAPGRINYSSGAESTIEGLSILLALERIDANGLVQSAALSRPRGAEPLIVEAESYTRPAFGRVEAHRQDHLAGSRPSGGGYVVVHDGSEVTLPLPRALQQGGRYRLDLVHGGARSKPVTLYVLAGEELVGEIVVGRDSRGDRLRTTYAGELSIDGAPLTLRIVADGGSLALDAVVVHPVVMWRQLEGPGGRIIALRNMTDQAQTFVLPDSFPLRPSDQEDQEHIQVRLYDHDGKPAATSGVAQTDLVVPPFGFGIAVVGEG